MPKLHSLARQALRIPCWALMVAALAAASRAGAATAPAGRALVVCDSWKEKPDGAKAEAFKIQQVLGHFPIDSDMIGMDDYQPRMLDRYRYCFFIGVHKDLVVPRRFLDDVRRFRGPFWWMNAGVDQLGAPFLDRLGFRYEGVQENTDFTRVRYHDTVLRKGDPETCFVRVTAPTRCKVLADALSKTRTTPYIVRSGNFWFIADSPFSYAEEGDRYFVFADLLHDFVGIEHRKELHALIRIEDVNPTTDVGDLRRVVNTLNGLNVPFAVALFPRYIDPKNGTDKEMVNQKPLVGMLRYLTSHGASIIMHGYIHRYHGLSGDDFEFWDRDRGSPIAEDSESYVEEHLRRGVQSLLACGLYPIAWETPHYAASERDYREVARHFSTYVERRTILDESEFGVYYPFLIQRDVCGQQGVPENLGYVEMKATRPDGPEDYAKEDAEVTQMLANAKACRVLRDASVGAFFHPFLDSRLLEKLARGLRNLGYEFTDLRTLNNRVQVGGALIITGKGSGTVALKNQYLHEYYVRPNGTVCRDSFSSSRITGSVTRSVTCPDGWIYVAQGAEKRPPSWWSQVAARARAALRTQPPAPVQVVPARTALLWAPDARDDEARDQESFEQTLTAMGFAPARVRAADLDSDVLDACNLLVAPHAGASLLSEEQCALIHERVRGGLNIVMDGYTPLSALFSMQPEGDAVLVRGAKALLANQRFVWRRPEKAAMPVFPPGAVRMYRDLDRGTVGAWFRVRQGRCFFLSTLFDPDTGMGYGRYPTFSAALLTAFPLEPTLTSKEVEVFFDPGYRKKVSIERLAVLWKAWGVRAVHVGMWHFYPKWVFDYPRLIKNCHDNGIAVYAWFDLPYVTLDFYKNHPQWREKTATGLDANADGKLGWRRPMAIEVPECRKEILRFVNDALSMEDCDWDGVNIAELYFENTAGPEKPEQFTPMHPYVRSRFHARFGYDPVELFRPRSAHFWKTHPEAWHQFEQVRGDLLGEVYRDVLAGLRPFLDGDKKSGRRELVVTALDSLGAPEIQYRTGFDMMQLLGMMAGSSVPGLPASQRTDFTLNVEDPQRMWSEPPDRYFAIGSRYRKLVKDPSRLMMDLNVVDFGGTKELAARTRNGFASADKARGIEVLEMVRAARAVAPRVLIYCEWSLSDADVPLLSAAYASAGSLNVPQEGLAKVNCTGLTFLRGPDDDDAVSIDGQRSLVNERGEVPVPPGQHRVESHDSLVTRAAHEVPTIRLLNVSGPVRRVQSHADSVLVEYDSLAPCLITTDEEPTQVQIDGRETKLDVLQGTGSWSVRCPSGRHTARLIAKGRAQFEAEVASALSSYTIVTVAGAASFLLLFLVSLTHVERRMRRRALRRAL